MTAPNPATGAILREISIACQLSRLSPTRFGRDAVDDPRLVADLRAGRELRTATAAKVMAHIRLLASTREVTHG